LKTKCQSLFPGTPKPANASFRFTQGLDLNDWRCVNLFQDQLSDPVALRNYSVSLRIGREILTLEIDLRMIEQQNFERTTIVLVDDTSASINKVLYRYSLDTSVFTTYLIQSEEQDVHKSLEDKR
jgi:hypothetical protein